MDVFSHIPGMTEMEEITEVAVMAMTEADMAMTEDNYCKTDRIVNTLQKGHI